MAKLKQTWVYLRSSLWFIPAVTVVGMIALALELIELDRRFHSELTERWPRLFAASPDGSQAMLAAIATSMMTVAGVVFSITIVALSQASSQYSPRVLRNFMRDRSNQAVLGFFVGIFAYCLVVLRNITREHEGSFVPTLGIFCGFLFALLGMGFLVYFIHHIASSIQASNMIHSITQETMDVIARMFPKRAGPGTPDSKPEGERCEAELENKTWYAVPAKAFGYVQQVEKDSLVRIGCRHDLTIRMEVGVGEFVPRERPLVSICGDNASEPDAALIRKINACYAVDSNRTTDQDPAFGIRQLVDIAVKSLSPGINDSTTAVTAVDYLSQLLCDLAGRRLEPEHYFSGPELRVIARGITFERLLANAFAQIIENAAGNGAVTMAMLRSLHRIADCVTAPERRAAVAEHVRAVTKLIPRIEPASTRTEARETAATIEELIRTA